MRLSEAPLTYRVSSLKMVSARYPEMVEQNAKGRLWTKADPACATCTQAKMETRDLLNPDAKEFRMYRALAERSGKVICPDAIVQFRDSSSDRMWLDDYEKTLDVMPLFERSTVMRPPNKDLPMTISDSW